jgi:4-hydroxy-L-threonine phosphate dehydrogenase PdxA
VKHAGHTEILAEVAGVPESSALTMFETGPMRIFFYSRHLSLAAAVAAVKREPLAAFIARTAAALEGIGVKGRIAVAGLNPHCGDGGLFGDEEGREIGPGRPRPHRR